MSIRFCVTFSLSMLLFANAGAFGGEWAPTAAEAEAVMRAYVVNGGGAGAETLHVREVPACFPAQDRPPGDVVCLVDMSTPGGEHNFRIQMLPFRQAGGSWSLLDPRTEKLDPVCPSLVEAQQAFRKIRKDETLVVTGGGEDGDIDDERGRFEKVTGPHRLICTYTVKLKLQDEDVEQTFVTYIWRKGGEYIFDPEIESWLD